MDRYIVALFKGPTEKHDSRAKATSCKAIIPLLYPGVCYIQQKRSGASSEQNDALSKLFNEVETCATLYSLIETAKANNLEPHAYLRYYLTEFTKLGRHAEPDDIVQLLP